MRIEVIRMKRVQGILKLYGLLEGITVLILFLIGVGMVFIKYLVFKSNSLVYSDLERFAEFLSMGVVFDYAFSFGIRYNMLSNFNSSRKLFYNTSIFAILFKSCSAAICGIVIILLEKHLYTFKGARHVVVILGRQVQDINLIELAKVFVLLLIGALTMWSISILFSSIGKFQLILMIFAMIATTTIGDILFSKGMSISGDFNYLWVCIIYLMIAVINFSLTWLIIKNKSNLRKEKRC